MTAPFGPRRFTNSLRNVLIFVVTRRLPQTFPSPVKTLSLALSGAAALLLAEPAFAQISESEVAPAEQAVESDPAPGTTESEANASPESPADEAAADGTAPTGGTAPSDTAPLVAEATTPPLAEAPVGEDPNAPPPLAEEPVAEATTSASDPNLELLLQRPPTPFDQGRIRLGVGLGWTSTSDTNWLILGAGLGIYVFDGLEVGLDSTFWVIGDPFVSTLTPGLRYVFIQLPSVKPYVGAFYRHYFVGDGWDDTDAIGGRLGVYFMLSQQAYLGGGIVYEHFLDDDLFASRDQFYPELTFSFAF